jgi:hypothetical protein
MEYFQLLEAEDLKGKPILLLLNKMFDSPLVSMGVGGLTCCNSDFPGRISKIQVLELVRYADLQAREGDRLSVLECSAFTGAGLDAVASWIAAQKRAR